MSGGPIMVWCPFPDEGEARKVAGTLLDEGLIACANILPGMVSLYEWQGERGEAQELGVLLKSNDRHRARLVERLAQLHSYQSPAIMVWDAMACPQQTHAWLMGEETGGQGNEPD